MDKFYIDTLGCKVNQAETDLITDELARKGLEPVGLGQSPDWCIINTCTVTSQTDKKVRQAIRKAKKTNPGARLLVTGCFAELNPDFLAREGVHHVVGNKEKMNISSIVSPGGHTGVSFCESRSRPLVKVQDGCRQFCTYCIVPLVRGDYFSVPKEKVIGMVKNARDNGFQEVVLTGIHLGKYGIDLKEFTLEGLLQDILNKTDIKRIRLSSIEIGEITEGLIKLMDDAGGRICSHLHIPLQSGSDEVLRSMGRPYKSKQFLDRLKKVKAGIPGIGITTDVMVGFPKESEYDFNKTLEAVMNASFSKVHVFRYSRRDKTPAAEMEGQVPDGIKKLRSSRLAKLGDSLREDYLKKNRGKVLEVVLEKRCRAAASGTSSNFIKVSFKPKKGLKKGKIYKVFTESMYGNGLWGKIMFN